MQVRYSIRLTALKTRSQFVSAWKGGKELISKKRTGVGRVREGG